MKVIHDLYVTFIEIKKEVSFMQTFEEYKSDTRDVINFIT